MSEACADRQEVARQGKTRGILASVEESIRRGNLVFLDMRADKDVPRILSSYAKKYGHKFYHWTIRDMSNSGPVYYDPLKLLGFTKQNPVTDVPFSRLVRSGAISAFTVAPSLSNADAGFAVDAIMKNLMAAHSDGEGESGQSLLNIMLDERNLAANLDSIVSVARGTDD